MTHAWIAAPQAPRERLQRWLSIFYRADLYCWSAYRTVWALARADLRKEVQSEGTAPRGGASKCCLLGGAHGSSSAWYSRITRSGRCGIAGSALRIRPQLIRPAGQ